MLRRSIRAVLCVLLLWPAWSASGGLVGWWPLDEISGNIAKDESRQGNDGTIVGTPLWAPGRIGGALEFNGSTYINCGNDDAFNITDAVTLAAWIQADAGFAYPDWSGIIMRGGANIDTFALYYNGPNRQLGFKTTGTTPNWFASGANSATAMFDNEWHHVAATYDGATKVIYVDGTRLASADATGKIETSTGRLLIGAGRDLNPATHHAAGKLDDVQIYDQALTEAEIQGIMEGLADKSLAKDPSPKDAATDVHSDAVLGWTPGEYAAAHDVYLGTEFADVNNAGRADPRGVLASQGQTATTHDPEGLLAYGQTYFWRIDEVNAAPDNTIFKGQVWSFTTESFGYPIANVTATASSSNPGMGPENTVNGSGLNANDQHSGELMHMWMSGNAPQPHWIQYEFDKVYKLHELWVWNSNQLLEAFVGFGARNVTIEHSIDAETWTVLEGTPEFAQATGSPSYTANTVVDFGGVTAKHVKLTIGKNWGVAPQTSLSEVRFFYVPVQAFEPEPADEATDVSIDTDLGWRPGREAQSHEVYLGADADALVLVDTLAEHNYTPASLDFGTTYYWKINEIGGDGPYEGEVWSFTTQEYAVVDDMESYNDDDNRIYDSWVDGWVNNTGSQVGYDVSPFAERTIIHGGKQSMPLKYDNAASPFVSEAERTFDTPQNWATNGADTLSLFVQGSTPAFAETASGSVLMNGIGTDIWGTADQFRLAYKTLTGNGTMVARVESIVNSNVWAKGGVMIRQSIEPGSTHAFMPITPGGSGGGNGASFQRRLLANQASTNNDSTTVVAAPYWVKIERNGSNFTGSISPDGKTWTQLGTAQTITMTGPVLIGLALCSHSATVVTAAEFSNISFTGNVTGAWQVAEIGVAQPAGNSMESLYVTVKDSSGKSKTVVNPDAAATVKTGWQQWKIPLSEFTSAGVKMNAVKTMTIGVGNKAAPAKGGTGTVFIDDVGFGRPAQ